MATSAHATGTLSTTGGGTEDFLTSPNVAGSFQLYIDLDDMASGDVIEFRVYTIVLTGGTARVVFVDRREGLQPTDDKILISVPVSTQLTETNGLRFSVKQTKGTAAVSLPWKVLRFS